MKRLKLSKADDKCILCEAIEGITHYGFGTFLENIQPKEIEADEFSKQALIATTAKDGLNGMEIWEDNRIAWGSPHSSILMPIDAISNMSGKNSWLNKIKIK